MVQSAYTQYRERKKNQTNDIVDGITKMKTKSCERISYVCWPKFLVSWHEFENRNHNQNTTNQLVTVSYRKYPSRTKSFFFRCVAITYVMRLIFVASLPCHLSCLADYGYCLCKRIWPSFSRHDNFATRWWFFSHLFSIYTFVFFASVCLSLRQSRKCVTICVLIHRISSTFFPSIDSCVSPFRMFSVRKSVHAWTDFNSGIRTFKKTNNLQNPNRKTCDFLFTISSQKITADVALKKTHSFHTFRKRNWIRWNCLDFSPFFCSNCLRITIFALYSRSSSDL